MELPVIDIEPYLHASATFGNAANVEEQQKLLEDLVSQSACLSNLCSEVSRSLKETGTLVIKDPRCSIDDNDRFLDMMEKYFEMPDEFKRLQARPTLHYQGPHLLAPTGSNLQKYGKEGTVFAGYHYDLNFLTIHGRSRFPGLSIWLRNDKKVQVKVPVGCLLIQAGKQIEYLTGGECIAGMHEVVVSKRTIAAIEDAQQGNHSLWRVSSTLFSHVASDAMLKPLDQFANSPLSDKYPAVFAGDFVEQELAAINLKGKRKQET
ncbi:unnamed protein product [Victoria cruziana]